MQWFKTRSQALVGRLHPLNYLIWLCFALTLLSGRIAFNPVWLWRQCVTMAFFTLGAGLEMTAGGIDLCFMAQAALSTVLMALLYNAGVPLWIELLVLLIFHCAVGAARGWLGARLDIPVIILTFALAAIFTNLHSPNISLVLPVSTYAYYKSFMVAMSLLLALGIVALGLFLHRTYYGRYALALGENPRVLRQCGVDVVAVSAALGALASLMFFGGTLMLLFVAPYGSTNRDTSYLYQVLAAAGLGGGISRRVGAEAAGLMIGAISMVMVNQLLTVYELDAYSSIVQGAAILTTFFAQFNHDDC